MTARELSNEPSGETVARPCGVDDVRRLRHLSGPILSVGRDAAFRAAGCDGKSCAASQGGLNQCSPGIHIFASGAKRDVQAVEAVADRAVLADPRAPIVQSRADFVGERGHSNVYKCTLRELVEFTISRPVVSTHREILKLHHSVARFPNPNPRDRCHARQDHEPFGYHGVALKGGSNALPIRVCADPTRVADSVARETQLHRDIQGIPPHEAAIIGTDVLVDSVVADAAERAQ